VSINKSDSGSRLVYSTESADKSGPAKEKTAEKILQAGSRALIQRVYVKLDRKGRGGKSVTLVEGLHLPAKESAGLLGQFKSRFGTGGSIKDGVLEIQGDHRDAIVSHLESMGYKPRRAGG
jgi:translation initiation factor 1